MNIPQLTLYETMALMEKNVNCNNWLPKTHQIQKWSKLFSRKSWDTIYKKA